MLVNATEMLKKAKAGHYAVGQFNINNLEWTKAILLTAQELNSPVILGVSEGAGKYMTGYKTVVGMVNGMMEELNITVPVALHLDHGSYEGCLKCVEAGFSSIMFDGSHYPIEENVAKTKELVKIVAEHGMSLEAEVGSIDEALAGYCTHIEVTIKPGNIIEVSDNGRGIPVDIQPKLGIPAVTVVYTVLHAGGKFGGEDSGYKVAGGLHGVGASVVNALSEWLVVHVRRDGAEYEQSFKRGKPDGDLKKIGVAASTGTTVTFKPDPEMFTETTEYDYEILLKRLREESFLNAGVRITLTDERPESIEKNDGVPPQESMCYEGGVRSFVQYLHEKRDLTPLHPQVIYMKGEANGAVAEVALQYCDSYNELILSFANNVHTPEGGTHEEGLKTALTRVFNEFGRAKGYLKEKAFKDNRSANESGA